MLALKQAEQFDRLRAVTARLAQVERAKGVLMERHKLSERDAHERLRESRAQAQPEALRSRRGSREQLSPATARGA